MKHSQARNVIERAFDLFKMRWIIIKGLSFYPIKTHCRIISACCLLHNFIRTEISIDPLEQVLDDDEVDSMQDIYHERTSNE